MLQKIFHGQAMQDEFIFNAFFKEYKKPGFFIELGALDGIRISNSLFYEKILHWKGICIEPTKHYYQKLCNNRSSYNFNYVIHDSTEPIIFCSLPTDCLNGVLSSYHERHIRRINKEIEEQKNNGNDTETIKYVIKPKTMDYVLTKVGVKNIDFLSLDTEGSELNILKTINWNTTKIKVICVEDNYGDPFLHKFLREHDYIFYHRIDGDYIYYNPELITPLK